MSAEGHLTNPAIFAGKNPPVSILSNLGSKKWKLYLKKVWEMCLEYLDLVDIYPCPLSYTRGHLFKMCHHLLQVKLSLFPFSRGFNPLLFQIQTNFDIRERIGKSHSFEEFRDCVLLLKERSDTDSGSAFPHFFS